MKFEERQEIARQLREDFFARVRAGDSFLDGVMSPQTLRLAEEMSAVGIDMTSAWSWTSEDWLCPACGRGKPEIVRLNSKRELMCRLVEHHDHMKDLVEMEFMAACKALDKIVADEYGKRFASRASQMVSAYDNAIICDDCNTADARAKEAISADCNFSFSPGEIRRFVKPRNNKAHEIDTAIASEIWQRNADTFSLRMKIVKRIASIAATNAHWYQELPLEQRADVIRERAINKATVTFGHEWLYALTGEPRTQKYVEPGSYRRVKQPRPRIIPTSKDIEFVARVTSARHWNAVADDWCCPGCGRTKNHVVRKSKEGWFFFFSEPSFYEPSGSRSDRIKVCGECSSLAMEIGKEAVLRAGLDSASTYAQFVLFGELKNVAMPQAHGRHNINALALDAIMPSIVGRVREKYC